MIQQSNMTKKGCKINKIIEVSSLISKYAIKSKERNSHFFLRLDHIDRMISVKGLQKKV